jgi:hypothetical protein
MHLASFFLFQHARNPRRFTNLILNHVSKLPLTVYILVMANVDIHGIMVPIWIGNVFVYHTCKKVCITYKYVIIHNIANINKMIKG